MRSHYLSYPAHAGVWEKHRHLSWIHASGNEPRVFWDADEAYSTRARVLA
jgi:hypothetical protein